MFSLIASGRAAGFWVTSDEFHPRLDVDAVTAAVDHGNHGLSAAGCRHNHERGHGGRNEEPAAGRSRMNHGNIAIW
jgi:hypothetical protein